MLARGPKSHNPSLFRFAHSHSTMLPAYLRELGKYARISSEVKNLSSIPAVKDLGGSDSGISRYPTPSSLCHTQSTRAYSRGLCNFAARSKQRQLISVVEHKVTALNGGAS